jgi:hypothetical protein
MNEARAVGGGRAGHHFGAAGMYGCEALTAALEQNPDQIDDDRAVAHRRLDRGGMAEIGLHGMDLPHPAERLQRAGEIGATHGGAHAVPVPGERPHHMSTEKTGGAEDRDEHVGIGNRGHGRRSRAQGRPRRTRTGAAAPFWALSIAAVRRHADWSPPGPPGRGCSYLRSLTGQCINTAIRIMLSAVVRSPVSVPIILSTLLFVRKNVVSLVEVAYSGLGYKSVPSPFIRMRTPRTALVVFATVHAAPLNGLV